MGRRRSGSLPVMRRRASTGHARAHANGKTYWLGPYGSPEAQVTYDALAAAYLATGRKSAEAAATPKHRPQKSEATSTRSRGGAGRPGARRSSTCSSCSTARRRR
jgi:hypothetical protein